MKILINKEQYTKIILEGRAKPEDRDKIYEDERITVVVPLTHKGSCKYGAYTKWCVATPSKDDEFKEYKENGVLIYFIINSPYPEADIKQYKFAYYHSFTTEMDSANGWYDMNDYHFNEPNESSSEADIKLIKFLIPKHIFDKVKEYIQQQKPIFDENRKKSGQLLADLILKDKTNKENMIELNPDWFIFFRLKPFGEEYNNFFDWEPSIQFNNYLSVFYFDRQKDKLYYQELTYTIDISNEKYKNVDQFRIIDIKTSETGGYRLSDIFHKYLEKIGEQYYRVRKASKFNGSVIYLPPEEVKPGDIYGDCRKEQEITLIKKKSVGEYDIQYKSPDGKIIKNAYYNKDWGVSICYNKEKHNSFKL